MPKLCLVGYTEGSVINSVSMLVVVRCSRKAVAFDVASFAAVALAVEPQRIDQVQKRCPAAPQTEHQVEAPYHKLRVLLGVDPALARR